MQTFGVKVSTQEKVTKTKRNGEWLKRFRVLVPEGLTNEDVTAILQLCINPKYKVSVLAVAPPDKCWSLADTVTLQEAKTLLQKLELFYYRKQTRTVHNTEWVKAADIEVSSCFSVQLEERLYEGWKIAFFHFTSLAKDVRYVSDALIEELKEQGIECRIAESGCPYIFTVEKLPLAEHFRLIKVDDTTYSLEELRVHTAYVTETIKVVL